MSGGLPERATSRFLSLSSSAAELDHHLLHGDLGRAVARDHRLALALGLLELGLGRAHRDVGPGVIRQDGDRPRPA